MYHHIWIGFVTVQLIAIVVFVLSNFRNNFQWMIALAVPLTKEINDRIIGFFMTKSASSGNLMETKFIGNIKINLLYSFWTAVTLGQIATKSTEVVLLGINFLINMRLCYKVINTIG